MSAIVGTAISYKSPSASNLWTINSIITVVPQYAGHIWRSGVRHSTLTTYVSSRCIVKPAQCLLCSSASVSSKLILALHLALLAPSSVSVLHSSVLQSRDELRPNMQVIADALSLVGWHHEIVRPVAPAGPVPWTQFAAR